MSYETGTLEEKKALQKSSSLLVLFAILLLGAGYTVSIEAGLKNPELAAMGGLLQLVGLVPWFWGLGHYCRSKGYSPWMAVLSLIPCVGLLMLVVLRNRYLVRQEAPSDPNSNYPR